MYVYVCMCVRSVARLVFSKFSMCMALIVSLLQVARSEFKPTSARYRLVGLLWVPAGLAVVV